MLLLLLDGRDIVQIQRVRTGLLTVERQVQLRDPRQVQIDLDAALRDPEIGERDGHGPALRAVHLQIVPPDAAVLRVELQRHGLRRSVALHPQAQRVVAFPRFIDVVLQRAPSGIGAVIYDPGGVFAVGVLNIRLKKQF